MKAWVLMIVGGLLTLMGVVWALQGLGYVGGSPMTGVTLWAIVGPIVALAGAGLVVVGIRSLRN
jgi:hypothetical protein